MVVELVRLQAHRSVPSAHFRLSCPGRGLRPWLGLDSGHVITVVMAGLKDTGYSQVMSHAIALGDVEKRRVIDAPAREFA